MRVLGLGLSVSAIGYGLSFFFVVGSKTFLISCLLTGIAYWMIMLAQSALTQEIFSQERFAQLGSANVMLQSVVIAFVISPLAGGLLDGLQNFHGQLPIPGFGTVEIGCYRFVNAMLAVIYGLALIGLWQIRRHRPKHTDAAGVYHPPV
jgi:MFS family permease